MASVHDGQTAQPETAKHTPGPWKHIRRTGDGKRIRVESHLDGTWERMTCDVDSDDCCSDTAMANARLIAAAPDLLQACINYAHGKKDARECEREMMDAIALAKGGGA